MGIITVRFPPVLIDHPDWQEQVKKVEGDNFDLSVFGPFIDALARIHKKDPFDFVGVNGVYMIVARQGRNYMLTDHGEIWLIMSSRSMCSEEMLKQARLSGFNF